MTFTLVQGVSSEHPTYKEVKKLKINEAEQRLGISKANIRFYEKQGLIHPARGSNGYREYSEEDIHVLQTVIVCRKLGLTVEEIGMVLNGTLDFQTAINGNILRLEEQVRQLTGALNLSKQIAREQEPELDTPRYWELVHRKEAEGEAFADVVTEFWTDVMLPQILARYRIGKGTTIWKAAAWILLINTCFALMRTFVWQTGSFLGSFLYWPCILLIAAVILFPIFWLGRKHPKAAGRIANALCWLCISIIGLAVSLLVFGLCRLLFLNIFG